jgi:hypothetical protein
MPLTYRLMKPSDVRPCVEIVATHPIFGPRYGGAIHSLKTALLKRMGHTAMPAIVFDEITGKTRRTLGVGVYAFITNEFADELQKPPYFWIGPEMVKRIAGGKSPLMTDRQLLIANSTDGVNVLPWIWGVRPEDLARPEIREHAMRVFYDGIRGFQVKRMYGQATTPEEWIGIERSGSIMMRDSAAAGTATETPAQIVQHPHVFYMTREIALRELGSWTSTVFVYHPPQLGFTVREQSLLKTALRGGTDEELADELGVSTAGVKKAWRSIYARVEKNPMKIFTDMEPEKDGNRGKGKKNRILAYVREHPEELRPISMKLLRRTIALAEQKTDRQTTPQLEGELA